MVAQTYTYTLYANKSAWINEDGGNDHISPQNTVKSIASETYPRAESVLLTGFDAGDVISQLHGKIITSAAAYFYISSADAYWQDDVSDKQTFAGLVLSSAVVTGGTWDETTITKEDINWYSVNEGLGHTTRIRIADFSPRYYSFQASGTTAQTIERYIKAAALVPGVNTYVTNKATVKTSRDTNKPYFVINAKDSTPVATPISPMGIYKNNADVIELQWGYSNAVGGTQAEYQIQYKDEKNTTWTELAAGSSSRTAYEVPADTFAVGTVQWRVKVISSYGIESQWSSEASFESMGAPAAPAVIATNSPRPLITWIAEDQQAYEVKINSMPSELFFGGNKEYKAKRYYSDGTFSAEVRTQNSYGMWSDWGRAEVEVVNISGEPITLNGHAGNLNWNRTSHIAYYVYRDGVPIAKTTDTTYTDRETVGTHTYVVRGIEGDNYSLSNEVVLSITVEEPQIASVSNAGKWLKLKYSTSQDRTLGIITTRDVVYQYYAGRQYPVAEMSPQITKIFNFNVAFNNADEAKEFEALLGETVIYKDQHNRRIIGPLAGYQTNIGTFFAEYTCSIQQTDVIEAVEYD